MYQQESLDGHPGNPGMHQSAAGLAPSPRRAGRGRTNTQPRTDGGLPEKPVPVVLLNDPAPLDGGRTREPEPHVRTLERRHTAVRGGIRCATGPPVLIRKARSLAAEYNGTGL